MGFRTLMNYLKLRKGVLLLSAIFVFVGTLYVLGFQTVQDEKTDKNYGHAIDVEEAYPALSPLTIEVQLRRVYLDGEASTEVVNQTIWSMEDFWSEYADWQLVDQNNQRIVFEKQINDISPLLKASGYFGVSEDGVLSIFNGKPDGQEIIQSFFQIDVKKVESYLQQQLKDGIPVKSKENYQKVLEVFKTYTK